MRSSDKITGAPDLLLGSAFIGCKALQPNRIYQMQEVLGDLIIKDMGPSAINKDRHTSLLSISWANDINYIVSHAPKPYFLLTQDEYKSICR